MTRAAGLPTVTLPWSLAHPISDIYKTYGDNVDVVSKAKSLLKFGKSVMAASTPRMIWELSADDETYVTTNAIDTISSSSATDTGIALRIEGHTVSGTGTSAVFTFSVQTVTVLGQAKVLLGTPLARVSRMNVVGVSGLAGDVYVYEDDTLTGGVPNTAAKQHIVIKGTNGDTQSYKAATTISNQDYFIMSRFMGSVNRQQTATVDFEVQVRTAGGVYRPIQHITANSGGLTTAWDQFDPYIIIPRNADVRILGESSATANVNASFQGYLASIIS